jgi:hypothetical protein
MTERHEDPAAGAGRPITTGEFRATPDVSASTAQFRAFAQNDAGPARPWETAAARRSSPRIALLIVIAVVVLAAIAILVASLS